MQGNSELLPIDEVPRQSRAMATTTPADLLAMAVSQGADLDRLEKLMALQERWEAGEARKAYVSAMAAFKAEPIRIVKSKAVGYETQAGDFVGYKHATMADVVDAVVPAMAQHGLSHSWDVTQQGGAITVTCAVRHRMGHSESVSMTAAPDNSGKKNAIQQVASTVTYLQRYTLMAICGVAAKDAQEDEGQSHSESQEEKQEPLTPEQEVTAREERKRQYFIAAYERNEDTVLQIKERLAFGDLAGAAAAWFDLSQDDQMALYLAPTKAGQYREKCFTTAQRETIKNELSKYRNKTNNNHGEEE